MSLFLLLYFVAIFVIATINVDSLHVELAASKTIDNVQLKKHATLFFLFVEEGNKFHNANVWSAFFRSRHQKHTKHHVIVHPLSNASNFAVPSGMILKLSTVKVASSDHDHQILTMNKRRLKAMQQLLIDGLTASTNDLDMFVFLSSDSIPLKPLSEIYTVLFNNGHGFVRSSFCLFPSAQWGSNASDPAFKAVRHSSGFILNKDDSSIIANKIKSNYQFPPVASAGSLHLGNNKDSVSQSDLSNKDYSASDLESDGVDKWGTSQRLSQFWFFDALYGELDLNRLVTVGDKQWAVVSAHSTNSMHDWLYIDPIATAQQGSCHTHYFDGLQSVITPHLSSDTGSRSSEQNHKLFNTSLEMLLSLRLSPSIFFAKSVVDVEDLASVYLFSNQTRFLDGKKSQHLVTDTVLLLDALIQLGVVSAGGNGDSNSTATDTAVAEVHTKDGHHHSFVAGSHMRFRHGRRDNTGLRVLVVSVDDRDVKDVLDSKDYVSMVSVLQQDYCMKHGYDYVSFRTDDTLLQKAMLERYPNITNVDVKGDKYGYASYHPGLNQFRASSWGKLPPLWYLTTEYGDHYDYVWFMDSDAAPNPMHNNRSLGDALADWKNDSESMVYRGNKNPYDATFLFLSNFPWRSDLPCAGTFIFKPNELGEAILREWWDYDLWMKNRADFMEQDALWYMLEYAEQYNFLMNGSVVSLLNENQFPSEWVGPANLWFAHIPNYDANRNQYFKRMLELVGKHTPSAFKAAAKEVRINSHMTANILDLAELMEDRHVKPYRTHYPECLYGKLDDRWHDVTDWGHRATIPKPKVADLYNNFFVNFPPNWDIYLVLNGSQYMFANDAAFESYGYDFDMVAKFASKGARERGIPGGGVLKMGVVLPPPTGLLPSKRFQGVPSPYCVRKLSNNGAAYTCSN